MVPLPAVARLAQGDVQVNQPRGGHQALGLDGLSRGKTCRGRANGDDFAGFQMQIGHLIQLAARINHTGAENAELHWAFSCSNWRWAVCPLMVMDNTAIRTAMP